MPETILNKHMDTFQLVIFVVGIAIIAIFALAQLAPALVDKETREVLLMQDEHVRRDCISEIPLHKAPKNNKEYILNDGSTVTIDATKTQVEEKEVFDPFGDEVLKPQKSPTERMGGGIAEVIRKRREEGVF